MRSCSHRIIPTHRSTPRQLERLHCHPLRMALNRYSALRLFGVHPCCPAFRPCRPIRRPLTTPLHLGKSSRQVNRDRSLQPISGSCSPAPNKRWRGTSRKIGRWPKSLSTCLAVRETCTTCDPRFGANGAWMRPTIWSGSFRRSKQKAIKALAGSATFRSLKLKSPLFSAAVGKWGIRHQRSHGC